MKSLYFSIFTVLCLIMKLSLANEYEEPYFNEQKLVSEYQNNQAPNNNEQNTVTEYQNNQAPYNNEQNLVTENQKIETPYNNEQNLVTENQKIETPYNNEQNLVTEKLVTNNQNNQNGNIESEKTKEKEGSNTSNIIFGGIGVTGVAFALVFGYKNYKRNVDYNNFKQEILSSTNFVSKEEIEAKASSSKNKETIVQIQPLLSESKNSANYELTKNRAYKCLTSWTPQNSDEIILRRGDLICVKECFTDGYTLGRNLSTKFDGIFPTCCLSRAEQNILGSELIKNGKFTQIPQRVTSKNKSGKRARRASRGISILPVWTQGSEFSSLLK